MTTEPRTQPIWIWAIVGVALAQAGLCFWGVLNPRGDAGIHFESHNPVFSLTAIFAAQMVTLVASIALAFLAFQHHPWAVLAALLILAIKIFDLVLVLNATSFTRAIPAQMVPTVLGYWVGAIGVWVVIVGYLYRLNRHNRPTGGERQI